MSDSLIFVDFIRNILLYANLKKKKLVFETEVILTFGYDQFLIWEIHLVYFGLHKKKRGFQKKKTIIKPLCSKHGFLKIHEVFMTFNQVNATDAYILLRRNPFEKLY